MIERDAYPLISEILKPESFYEHRHQLLYKAIQTLAIQQKPVDILTVAEQLRSAGELEEVGGPVYISQLAGSVNSSAHIEPVQKVYGRLPGTISDQGRHPPL